MRHCPARKWRPAAAKAGEQVGEVEHLRMPPRSWDGETGPPVSRYYHKEVEVSIT